MKRYLLIVSFLAAVLLMPPSPVASERTVKRKDNGESRLALVIGNGGYKESPLRNPVNDARAVAETLRNLDFEVIERTNLDFEGMNRAVDLFGERMHGGGVALFYFAGHGVQYQGKNYLVPLSANIKKENEIRYRSMDAGLVLAKMEDARNRINIVILDACRNNPFARSFRSYARGLASMTDAPDGSIIAFATAPGRTASDGEGKNGLYTGELIRQMTVPGKRLVDIFYGVRRQVKAKSGGLQVPWEHLSLVEPYYMIPPSGEPQLVRRPEPAPIPEPPARKSVSSIRIDSDEASKYVAQSIQGFLSREFRCSLDRGAGKGDGILVELRSQIEEEVEYRTKRVRLRTHMAYKDQRSGRTIEERHYRTSGSSEAGYEYALRQASDLMVITMKKEDAFGEIAASCNP